MITSEKELFPIKRKIQPEQAYEINQTVAQDRGLVKVGTRDVGRNILLVSRPELYRNLVESGHMIGNLGPVNRKIFEPIIPSSLQPIDRRVSDIQYLDGQDGAKELTLFIDDEDGVLTNERDSYLRRANPRSLSDFTDFTPQVSLALIRPELATTALLDKVASHMPSMVTLNPITTASPFIKFMPREMRNAQRADWTQHKQASGLNNKDVRTLGHIPQSFIDSLRPRTSDEEPTA